jgi:ribosome-binding factor A
MNSRRLARASEAVREVASTTILFELRDPRIKQVTVLGAEVAKDMRTAKVYVSVMGTPKQQSLAMYGLESARGFIQAKIAERLDTRYTPVLKFVLDQGVKKSIEAARLLREVLPEEESAAANGDEAESDAELESDDEANVTAHGGDVGIPDRALTIRDSSGIQVDDPEFEE